MIKIGQVYHSQYFMPTVLRVEIDKVKVKEHRNYLANKKYRTFKNMQGVKILPI